MFLPINVVLILETIWFLWMRTPTRRFKSLARGFIHQLLKDICPGRPGRD